MGNHGTLRWFLQKQMVILASRTGHQSCDRAS